MNRHSHDAEACRGVQQLDSMDDVLAVDSLFRCCGSRRWTEEMLRRRPFATRQGLWFAAEQAADLLRRDDWLEAFSHHPRIGDVDRLRERFASTAVWSEGEQASVAEAEEQVLVDLAAGNRAYEERFGFIFIVCASGKSASEMLALLRHRLDGDPTAEWQVAAGEQRKITRLRLEKLIDQGTP